MSVTAASAAALSRIREGLRIIHLSISLLPLGMVRVLSERNIKRWLSGPAVMVAAASPVPLRRIVPNRWIPGIQDEELAVIAEGQRRRSGSENRSGIPVCSLGVGGGAWEGLKITRGGLRVAPCGNHQSACDQFAVARGLGGKAEFFCTPRRRSRAVLSALSFFGSGGT